ncbi:MAG: hypothetical protein O7C75_17775, partial [Verrucomicrobia bacterium]|nr:hypothetical protein [Verrucomicrobiota bacterium]
MKQTIPRNTFPSAAAPLYRVGDDIILPSLMRHRPSKFPSIIPISSISTKHLVAALAFSAITLVLMASFAMAQQQQERPTQGQQATAPAAAQRSRGPAAAPGSLTFNTVITKLKAGQQVFSNTISRPDLEAAKKACEGQDFIWIEMQHSTLTWRETQNLIEVIVE